MLDNALQLPAIPVLFLVYENIQIQLNEVKP